MEESTKYLLIGGGLASIWAAQNIRERDKDGELIIVCDEHHPPYDKPPLSKSYIAKDNVDVDTAYSKLDNYYPDNHVQLRRGHAAVGISPENHTVTLGNGDTIRYEKLLLATGGEPRKLIVPGTDLHNVLYLRTIEDAQAIHDAAESGKKAVLVGAGYLNMEVASGLLDRSVDVTIIEKAGHPWSRSASPVLGGFLADQYKRKGARFGFGDEIESFVGSASVEAVITKSGKRLPTDFVLVGIGVDLRTGLAAKAGLAVDPVEGVMVDEYLRTSDPDVWAAGDIACFQDIALGKRWHAEHHLNAKWQGRAAGANMAGEQKVYDQIPYFFSDFLDLHMILRGDPAGNPENTTVLGDLPGAEFVELYPDAEGRIRMGVGISREEKRTDEISDKLELLIRDRAFVSDATAASFEA